MTAACSGPSTNTPTLLPTATLVEPFGTSVATNAPIVADETAAMAGIQQTLNRYADLLNANKLDNLRVDGPGAIVDPANLPLRRLVIAQSQNDILRRGTTIVRRYQVKEVIPRINGFMQAQIEREDGDLADWLFRNVDGVWLLSEPNVEQLGPRQEIHIAHFVVLTYPWTDAETLRIITGLLEHAYTTVKGKLEKVPDEPALVALKPVYALAAYDPMGTLAYYDQHSHPDRIVIYQPGSFTFGFYPPGEGWGGLLSKVLTHEYTHLVTQRRFMPLDRMADWMVEGIADYVAGEPRADAARAAFASGDIIPIVDPKDGVTPRDLQHLTILGAADHDIAYGYAASLVAYIVDRHGGLDGFWRLAMSYSKEQALAAALQQAFGITYAQFDTEWRDWLHEHYR
jgi:hypothetical protein